VPIPTDVVVAKRFAADAEATVKAATDVADDDLILDIGPQTAARLAEQLHAEHSSDDNHRFMVQAVLLSTLN